MSYFLVLIVAVGAAFSGGAVENLMNARKNKKTSDKDEKYPVRL